MGSKTEIKCNACNGSKWQVEPKGIYEGKACPACNGAGARAWATYMVDSMNQKIASIRGRHLTESVESIEAGLFHAMREELGAMRRAFDGYPGSDTFWHAEGSRAVCAAWERELVLAKFKAALRGSAYVRAGNASVPGTRGTFLVYGRNPTSPTGVTLAASAPMCPESEALLAAHQSCVLSPSEGLNKSGALA